MSEEDNRPQVKAVPYQSPMYNYGSSIILLTNPENILFKLELTLRGMQLDKDEIPVPKGDPLLNEKGVCAVIGMVQTIVNQVTIMSNLNDNEISNLMKFLADTLARDLMVNRLKYEIKDISARDKIYFTTLSQSFICMKRAYEEGDKRFWKGSTQEITTRVDGGNQRQGGMLQRLMGWVNKNG